jgi:4-amino-4-deoxy-L-arabinose transferase-like glycosyltransferase
MLPAAPPRPRSTLLSILLLWVAFYASFTLFHPPLLDDADSVHAEVAREMLLRHDYVTLYANGIRYLEKAPLLYWSMAASIKLFQLCGATSPRALAVAARIPLAISVLALALILEAFARRLFHRPERPSSGPRSGLYAALILLSSFGIFLFTRIIIPDAAVCLWTTLALYFFWRTEEMNAVPQNRVPHLRRQVHPRLRWVTHHPDDRLRLCCGGFAAACALNVLTKGLIGVVFPVAIVAIYLLLTRGIKRSRRRLRELHPWATFEAFFLIAAPWHILAGLANPTQGHPTPFQFIAGHWLVPLPNDGNVRGWFWFYFMNEHVLRYLNLRIPHDYDTAPLWLFWGLCFLWMMPWSAFVFKATAWAAPAFGKTRRTAIFRSQLRRHDLPLNRRGALLLLVWAAFVLLFFAFSTRQEYYVLPALPAVAILIAGWLAHDSQLATSPSAPSSTRSFIVRQAAVPDGGSLPAGVERGLPALRITLVLLILGTLFAAANLIFLLHAKSPAPHTDLAKLLQQNPGDYALSMGHFLDLNARALGLFRLPLTLAALSLFLGPLLALILRRKARPHAANISLAAGAFGFLLAAHLGLQTFAPVLTSAQLAEAIAPQVQGPRQAPRAGVEIHPNDLIVIHGEYESGSTLGFYLQRPSAPGPATSAQAIHILEGRSSNLWYGSFFPDAPPIFETPQSIAAKWLGPQRIFLWQSLTNSDDPPNHLPALPGPVYILVKSGGKEIVSNQPNH